MRWFYYRFIYRRLMEFLHRRGWHHMKHLDPHPIDERLPYGFLKCDWCGIHSDVPYSWKAKDVETRLRAAAALEQKP